MDPNQQPGQQPQPSVQPPVPQTPSSYTPPVEQNYDPNYLDSIAPAAPKGKFLSGTFGKLFWVLMVVFVFAVSLIVAFSGKDDTADLQQIAVRLDNFSITAKTVDKNIKSKNLKNINSTFIVWLGGNKGEAESLLKTGGVNKTEYNKDMVKREKALTTSLDTKYEDARLSGRLNRVYASSMAAETEKLMNLLTTMSKRSKSKQIRDFAKTANSSLTQINKDFNDFTDDGN